MKITLPIPVFIARWLFPKITERAETHGKAASQKRYFNGVVEINAEATTTPKADT